MFSGYNTLPSLTNPLLTLDEGPDALNYDRTESYFPAAKSYVETLENYRCEISNLIFLLSKQKLKV